MTQCHTYQKASADLGYQRISHLNALAGSMMPSTTARRGAKRAQHLSDSTRYALTSMNVMAHQPSPTTSYPSVMVERCGMWTTGKPCVSSATREKLGRKANGKGVGGRKIFFYICDTSLHVIVTGKQIGRAHV